MHMEDPSSFSTSFSSPPKCIKSINSAVNRSTANGRRGGRPFKLQITEQREEVKEQAFVRKVQGFVALDQAKHHFHAAQSLAPLTADKKPQNLLKLSVKEQTKPVNFKLHTEERAARRAGFNHLVASKISSMEILRRFEEKIEKVSGRLIPVMEEEEIRNMRKEMVPKAQLMPIFDRPFFPQRSTRPLTVPKEPKFCFLNKKCGAGQDAIRIEQLLSQNLKAIR